MQTKMNKIADLKTKTQEIIDLIAYKDFNEANFKLQDIKELLDELTDFTVDDKDLMEISKYQVLISQLSKKIVDN